MSYYFSVNVSILAVVFRQKNSKNRQFCLKLVRKRSPKNNRPHSKTIKNAKKLLIFGENDSRRLCNFLQTHIFWNFDHISRTYNQVINRNFWFAKITIILIMIAQVLFSVFFFKKTCTLMSLSNYDNWW